MAITAVSNPGSVATSFITFPTPSNRIVTWYKADVEEIAKFTVTITGTLTTNDGNTVTTQMTAFTITTEYPLCSETPESVVVTSDTPEIVTYIQSEIQQSKTITEFT